MKRTDHQDPFPHASAEEEERNPMGCYLPEPVNFCGRCRRMNEDCGCGAPGRGILAGLALAAIVYACIWLVAKVLGTHLYYRGDLLRLGGVALAAAAIIVVGLEVRGRNKP